MTFMSDRNGRMFSSIRAVHIAIAGTNAQSDAWRPNRDRGPDNTLTRIGLGFGGRLLRRNMWEEFWPDVRQLMLAFLQALVEVSCEIVSQYHKIGFTPLTLFIRR